MTVSLTEDFDSFFGSSKVKPGPSFELPIVLSIPDSMTIVERSNDFSFSSVFSNSFSVVFDKIIYVGILTPNIDSARYRIFSLESNGYLPPSKDMQL